MAAGDGLIKVTALTFTTQDVRIRFDVGVEKTGGAFVRSDERQLTLTLREFWVI